MKLAIIQSLIEHVLGWPVAIFGLGLLLRKQISKLLERPFSIGHAGLTLTVAESATSEQTRVSATVNRDSLVGKPGDSQAPLAAPELEARRKLVLEFGQGNAAVELQEKRIKDELNQLFPNDEDLAATVLTRHFAKTHLLFVYAITARNIFGSQVSALKLLAAEGYQKEAPLARIFDTARDSEPDFYGTYSLKQWLAFLSERDLINQKDDEYGITVYGVDFLYHFAKYEHGPHPH